MTLYETLIVIATFLLVILGYVKFFRKRTGNEQSQSQSIDLKGDSEEISQKQQQSQQSSGD